MLLSKNILQPKFDEQKAYPWNKCRMTLAFIVFPFPLVSRWHNSSVNDGALLASKAPFVM